MIALRVREHSPMVETRTARVTEAKQAQTEKSAGRKPDGPPPAKVNPAPQIQNSSKSDSPQDK